MGLHESPRWCVACKLSDELLPSRTVDAGAGKEAVAFGKAN